MTLEQIQQLWNQDSIIDQSNLSEESLKISQLHSKYYIIYSNEHLVYIKMLGEHDKLSVQKREFYTQGPTKQQHQQGWKLPDKGVILKNEADGYINADEDIISSKLRLAYQKEKVDFAEQIIRAINNRSFQIKNAIDFIKFTNGAS